MQLGELPEPHCHDRRYDVVARTGENKVITAIVEQNLIVAAPRCHQNVVMADDVQGDVLRRVGNDCAGRVVGVDRRKGRLNAENFCIRIRREEVVVDGRRAVLEHSRGVHVGNDVGARLDVEFCG